MSCEEELGGRLLAYGSGSVSPLEELLREFVPISVAFFKEVFAHFNGGFCESVALWMIRGTQFVSNIVCLAEILELGTKLWAAVGSDKFGISERSDKIR